MQRLRGALGGVCEPVGSASGDFGSSATGSPAWGGLAFRGRSARAASLGSLRTRGTACGLARGVGSPFGFAGGSDRGSTLGPAAACTVLPDSRGEDNSGAATARGAATADSGAGPPEPSTSASETTSATHPTAITA